MRNDEAARHGRPATTSITAGLYAAERPVTLRRLHRPTPRTTLQRAQAHLLAALRTARADTRTHEAFLEYLIVVIAREQARGLDREPRP